MEIWNIDSNGGENIACNDKGNQMKERFQQSLPLNQNDVDLGRPLSNQRFKIQNPNRISKAETRRKKHTNPDIDWSLTNQIKSQKQKEEKEKKSLTTQPCKNTKSPRFNPVPENQNPNTEIGIQGE